MLVSNVKVNVLLCSSNVFRHSTVQNAVQLSRCYAARLLHITVSVGSCTAKLSATLTASQRVCLCVGNCDAKYLRN